MIVTNGSMQADAFLFDELVAPGDAVIVEKPTLRPHAARPARARRRRAHGRAAARRHRHRRAAHAARGRRRRRRSRTSSPTSRTRPATRCRSPSATALLALAREYGFTIFEDDPYVDIRFRGEPLPTMLVADTATARVVYASSFTKTVCPGIRVGYLVGPEDLIAQIVKRATNTYISPDMVAQAIVYEFCASGDIDRSIATVKDGAQASAARRSGEALSASSPRRASPRPTAATSSGSSCPRAPTSTRSSRPPPSAACRRQGLRLPARGWRERAAPGLLRRHARQIDEGVGRLAEAYRSLLATRSAVCPRKLPG